MSNVFRSFMAQAARGGRSRRNFSSLPEVHGSRDGKGSLTCSSYSAPGFLYHGNKLAAEKEVTMRRLEKLKKLSSENDFAQVSWKQFKKLSAEYDLAQVSGKKE